MTSKNSKTKKGPRSSKTSLKDLKRNRRLRRTLNGQYSTLKHHAKERKVPFTITLEQFRDLRAQPCFYECGNPLSAASGSLDRLHPKGPYSVANVVPCCSQCNQIKGDWWTWQEMLVASRAVNRMRKRNAKRAGR